MVLIVPYKLNGFEQGPFELEFTSLNRNSELIPFRFCLAAVLRGRQGL
jgi:hypothetical protein